ncbi:hypothetical protein [uncultured Polaribacter sp.]|uniref:hypothetical protein n=1 Tax=uncultured Polaribacter sp. TaxID=174711 RepID=UPI0030DD3BF4|tara:strand:- start:4474 stop:4932 length:459 start_codon:yes stop_codon:yes gene_type:complete
MESKENNLPQKAEEISQKIKNAADNINTTAKNVGNTLNKFSQTANNFNDLGKTFVESKKIKAHTSLGLEKIKQNHQTINHHIDTEYKKQKQAMDKAENVIDSGLESGNIDLVKIGLDSMTGIANHNPMTDLKNHLDSQIEKDFEDDDFIIEI